MIVVIIAMIMVMVISLHNNSTFPSVVGVLLGATTLKKFWIIVILIFFSFPTVAVGFIGKPIFLRQYNSEGIRTTSQSPVALFAKGKSAVKTIIIRSIDLEEGEEVLSYAKVTSQTRYDMLLKGYGILKRGRNIILDYTDLCDNDVLDVQDYEMKSRILNLEGWKSNDDRIRELQVLFDDIMIVYLVILLSHDY